MTRDDLLTKELIEYCRRFQRPAVLPDTIEAADAWGANCGPMSLAAVLGLPTVEAARELVHPFRGFMSPTDMNTALCTAQHRGHIADRRSPLRDDQNPWPHHGLVRIQWIGPWCAQGVNPRAAYRYTHWVAVRAPVDIRSMDWFMCRDASVRAQQANQMPQPEVMIYDATPNRWIPLERWSRWCETLWPKRATGWAPVTRIDVVPLR